MGTGRDIKENTEVRFETKGTDSYGRYVDITRPEIATRIDEVSESLIYIGYADLGAAESASEWKIKKMEKVGNVWSQKFVNGKQDYNNIWDNRASYTYS